MYVSTRDCAINMCDRVSFLCDISIYDCKKQKKKPSRLKVAIDVGRKLYFCLIKQGNSNQDAVGILNSFPGPFLSTTGSQSKAADVSGQRLV